MQRHILAEPELSTSRRRTTAYTVAAALAGAALITLAAHIRIPMWPVPMTMQPFVVLMIGAVLSRRAALGAVSTYLAMAAGGLPVLAGATGLGGPTTGYLLSYLLVAILLPTLRERGLMARASSRAGSLVLAMMVIYAGGLAWLTAFWTPDFAAALRVGALPFLLGDMIKVGLAFLLLSSGYRQGSAGKRP